jgi:Uncharacterized conserved protein
MVRPRWIGALAFALLVAAGFAWLGQWQLARAIDTGTVVEQPTETTVPLTVAASPASPLHTSTVGQLVTARGTFVSDDYTLISGRLNNGPSGYWVVGRMNVEKQDASGTVALAVARGFAPSRPEAERALAQLRTEPAQQLTLTGRLLPSEEPQLPDPKADPRAMTTMSVAALINVWPDLGDSQAYEAYVVERGTPPAGLDPIFSPPPIEQETINWLNIFYAAEWAIFAGFAVFLWYRLARDTWERERDDYQEALAAASTSSTSSAAGSVGSAGSAARTGGPGSGRSHNDENVD